MTAVSLAAREQRHILVNLTGALMTGSTLTRRCLLGAAAALSTTSPARGAETNVLEDVRVGTAVPGMAAVVIHNFGAEREIVSGVRRLGSSDPIRRGDHWKLASCGKAMTATLIARLCARGVLSWQAPLERMLPDLASTMHPSYRDVTLPDLLSHRSGLPEMARDTDFLITFVDDAAPFRAQRRRYVEAALGEPPVAEKRTQPNYSNSGFVVAAAIAEQATGGDYEELMREQVFDPLRMRSATFEPYGGPNEVIGHVDGRIADQRFDPNPRMLSPSDGCRLSLGDWRRFCVDQMRGTHGLGRLMHGDVYRFMQTPQGESSVALGWMTQAHVYERQGPAIYHSGSDGNWMAEVLLFPRVGDGALVVANSAYGMDGNTATRAAVRQFAGTLSAPAA